MNTKLFRITGLIFVLAFFGCNSPKTEKSDIQQESEIISETDKPEIEQASDSSMETEKQIDIERNVSIQDAWGNDAIGNAFFAFYEDSVYYPDPNLWYQYDILGDTIRIFHDDNYIEKLLIKKLDKDSLVVEYLQLEMERSYHRRN